MAEIEVMEIAPAERVKGKVSAPPSKAYTLRGLFIAALAEGRSVLRNALYADDQKYAAGALKMLGARVEFRKGGFSIEGTGGKLKKPAGEIFLGNSGVSVRFLASVAALAPAGEKVVITGNERMQSGRPIQDLLDALAPLGIKARPLKREGYVPIEVAGGGFEGGKTKLRGDVSSQYFSSILVAAPYSKKGVAVETEGELRSKPYIDITLDSMEAFGARAENNNYGRFFVEGGQCYKGRKYTIEGDFSNAAYFFAAAAITKGRVAVENLNPESRQGDRFFVDCLERMGCRVKRGKNSIEIEGRELEGIEADMNDYPDIVQPLAVVAAFANGRSEFSNIAHLKYKECDRLACTAAELRKTGIEAVDTLDSLVVKGGRAHGAKIETYNDHRMAMSFSVMGLAVKGMRIINPKAVGKSFPEFYSELSKIAVSGKK